MPHIPDWRRFYASRVERDPGDSSSSALIEICPDSSKCWASVSPSERSSFSMACPYLGNLYERGRVVVYGQNLNLGQGDPRGIWDWLKDFVATVSQHQRQGKKRTNGLGDEKYRTPFWHFLIAYATTLTNHLGITHVADPYEDVAACAETWGFLALSEMVKCQPFTGNGKPTSEMWLSCSFCG